MTGQELWKAHGDFYLAHDGKTPVELRMDPPCYGQFLRWQDERNRDDRTWAGLPVIMDREIEGFEYR